ncbi:MAG TPA: hypothetical protein VIP70_11360 [Nitrososphaeraceae archaeon]
MTKFDSHKDDISVDVFIKNVRGTEIASKLSGHFVINGQAFRFRAIAFGRIGGHNISLSISKKTSQGIKRMGINPEAVELKVQRKLVEGDIIISETQGKEI